jgi:hypothetical protein
LYTAKFEVGTFPLVKYEEEMSKFAIQYASNFFVHQNATLKQSKYLLKTGICPNLALLGNIGNPRSQKTKDFIRWCSDNWDHVYCVPGPLELMDDHRLNGLFVNFPKNVHILDQSEKLVHPNLVLLGCPLWSGWADMIAEFRDWSEEERYFMANRTPNHIRHWHTEDLELIVQNLRENETLYAGKRKTILLTHNLFDLRMLSKDLRGDEGRNIFLHDGNIREFKTPDLRGVLCGAGGGTYSGLRGYTQVAVNGAFRGPSMVPNLKYRPDAIASFDFNDDEWPTPYAQYLRKVSGVNLSKYLPKPSIVGFNNANSVLQ